MMLVKGFTEAEWVEFLDENRPKSDRWIHIDISSDQVTDHWILECVENERDSNK